MTAGETADHLSTAKRALYEIRTLKAKVAELEAAQEAQREPIAIVGMGLRFPGSASTPDAFWDLLSRGVDAVGEIPPSRWPVEQYFDANADAPGKTYARHGAFLEDPALFDADFFGISPREAASLDPQHRLALEVVWEALENAGRSPQSLTGSATGVFLAASNSDYCRMVFGQKTAIDAYSGTGNIFSVMAGRISYLLGLHGPSLVVDTACSGSLVALHLACQSLRAGECHLALAGGVNLILSPEIHINFAKSRMMAPDGKCKTFDAAADGYVRGEGCGVVVLKRLSEALVEGDRILALIHSTAVNQDGHSSGVTAPNGLAQEALLRQALAAAGIHAGEIDYVEAHGTGTSLGDPIEARALDAVIGAAHTPARPLFTGSVKTNIGHLEAAAGMASLIKTVLALEHEQIPPHLHFEKLNPHIEWGERVQVPTAAMAWQRGEKRRLAGVSSFGFSGTNAHVILGEAPAGVMRESHTSGQRPLHILTLSARTKEALAQQKSRMAEVLAGGANALGDICFTANAGRAQWEHRAAYVGGESQRMLGSPVAEGVKESTPEIAFLFPGQGAQFAGMGRELYQTQPVFRRALDECAELLRTELREPLGDVLWGPASALLDQTEYTQPALFAVEYALSELWRSWGIEPAVVLGHSVGEYVAACVAGVYSLADGLKLIATRARLMQNTAGRGGMTAIAGSEGQAKAALAGLEDRIAIAAINGPESVVISGFAPELEIAEQRLRLQGLRVQRLAVSHGFHSPQMRPMEEAFAEAAKNVTWHAPRVRLISSMTGSEVGPREMADAEYWRLQISRPVLFQKAIQALRGYPVFVEIGPGTTLTGLGQSCIGAGNSFWTPSMRKSRGEWEQMLESLGGIWVRGVDVDWAGFDQPYQRRRVALPAYPFERRPYWIERDASSGAPEAPAVNDSRLQWESCVEAARRQAAQGRLDLDIAQYGNRWKRLDALATAYIVAALREIGLFRTPGECYTVESAIQRFRVLDVYRKLLRRWFERLADEGLLERDGLSYGAARGLEPIAIEPRKQEAQRAFGGNQALVNYAIRCGAGMADVMTGRLGPLETLFPGGDFAPVEDMYEHDPLSAYFNSMAGAALEGIVRARGANPIRVLEIGGGTGSTTSSLLAALPLDRTDFHFTDVSESFLNHAEKKFARYPFVRYRRLDIETDVEPQGFAPGSFDVVAATNVFHATRDVRATVAHAKSLLAPGGVLLLIEQTEYFWWLDATIALIAGWQRFDDGLREEHPLIAHDTWRGLLEEAGFARIVSAPDESSPATILGRRVLIAQTAGESTSSRLEVNGSKAIAQPAGNASGGEPDRELAAILAAPPVQRREQLVALVRQHIAALLRFDTPQRVELRRRLVDMGIDSLMAVELRNRLAKALRTDRQLPASLIFDYPTVEDLAVYVEREVLGLSEPAEAAVEAKGLPERARELESLDDAEAEALLLERLQSL